MSNDASASADRAFVNGADTVPAVPASIPSAEIVWNPNPLLTAVRLSDADKERLRAGIMDDLEDEVELEHFFPIAVAELEGGEAHCGDCTCVPMSCMKCAAENWLGINTILGIGKHSLYKISDAFKPNPGDIESAIRNLENYSPKADWEGWEAHAPRWRKEADGALIWLKAYRDKHFPAQAMEARRAETGTGSVHDSAVRQDAPKTNHAGAEHG